jgi:hypothetical protein
MKTTTTTKTRRTSSCEQSTLHQLQVRAFTMSVLKLPSFITIALLFSIVKVTTSAELKLNHHQVVNDKANKVLLVHQ